MIPGLSLESGFLKNLYHYQGKCTIIKVSNTYDHIQRLMIREQGKR